MLCYRGAESSSRIITFALVIVAYGVQGVSLAMSLEVLLTLVVSGVLFASAPLSRVRREIFDLAGVHHGYGEMLSGFHADNQHYLLGTATVRETYRKLTFKLIVQVCIIAASVQKLQFQRHLWVPSVAFISVAIVIQFVFLAFRVMLVRRREGALTGLKDAVSLDAWRIPLLEANSVEFLQAINDELIVCRYLAGDYILRTGELDGVIHLMVKGVGFVVPTENRDSINSFRSSNLVSRLRRTLSGSAAQLFRSSSSSSLASSSTSRAPSSRPSPHWNLLELQVPEPFKLSSGLQWRNTGHVRPIGGRSLQKPELAEALTRTTEFTQQEWDAFGIANLRVDDFIKSGHCYFMPVSRRDSPGHSSIVLQTLPLFPPPMIATENGKSPERKSSWTMKDQMSLKNLDWVEKHWSAIANIFKGRGFNGADIDSHFKSRIQGQLVMEGSTAGESSFFEYVPNALDVVGKYRNQKVMFERTKSGCLSFCDHRAWIMMCRLVDSSC